MAKATTNGRFETFVRFLKEHEHLSDEDRKKLLGLIAEDEEPTDERRQHEFENRVVDRVLQELSLKDGKRMLDYLFINLAHRFEQKGHLKRLVGEHLSRRMRVLAGLTTFFAIAFSAVGYYSMTTFATIAGGEAARAELDKKFPGFKADLQERVDTKAKLAEERFKETAANIERTVMLAQTQMTASLLQFQTDINNNANKAINELEVKKQEVITQASSTTAEAISALTKGIDGQIRDFTGRIDEVERTVGQRIEARGKSFEDKLKQWEDQQKKNTEGAPNTEKVGHQIDGRGPAFAETTGRSPGTQSDAMIDLMVEAIGLAVERKFEFPPMFALATKAAKEGASDIIRSSFSALLDMPSSYTGEERSSAAGLMLDKSIDPQERLHNATECMMAAARADDRAMFEKAQAARKDNFLSRALGRNVFVEVAEAYITGKNGAEFGKLLEEVDYESLQTRGYLNLYAIAKKAAANKTDLPEPTLRKRQDELLKQIRGSNFIDRPSDYSAAYFLIDALNAEPFLRDSAIAEVLDLVEKEVFREDNTEDPWKLKDLIATVRTKLTPPPSAPSQPPPNGESGQTPAEHEKAREPKPEQPNP